MYFLEDFSSFFRFNGRTVVYEGRFRDVINKMNLFRSYYYFNEIKMVLKPEIMFLKVGNDEIEYQFKYLVK